MKDSLLETLLTLALNNPLATFCLAIGTVLFVGGFFMAVASSTNILTRKGSCLMVAGAAIAFPAYMPMLLFVAAGLESPPEIFLTKYLAFFYVIMPWIGVFVVVFGWHKANKDFKSGTKY